MARNDAHKDDASADIAAPETRLDFAGNAAAEERLRQLLDQGALSNGWMLAGPDGIGKATLAYRVARAYLARQDLTGPTGLGTADSKTAHLVAQKAHPDLFVAERGEKADFRLFAHQAFQIDGGVIDIPRDVAVIAAPIVCV